MSFMDASYLGMQAINNMNAYTGNAFDAGMANSIANSNAIINSYAGQPTGYNPVYQGGSNGPGGQTIPGTGMVGGYPSFGEAQNYGGQNDPFSGGYSPSAQQQVGYPQQPSYGGDPNSTPYDGYTGVNELGESYVRLNELGEPIIRYGMNDMGMPPDYGQPGGGGASFADRFNAVPQQMRDWHPQSYEGLPPAITSGVQPSLDLGRVPDNFNSRFGPMEGEPVYQPSDFPGWTPPQQQSTNPDPWMRIVENSRLNAMNSMGGDPSVWERSQITPTPQERPADAPPMTTQNPIEERWGGQPPSNADAMRDAIALQQLRNQGGYWAYANTPYAGQVGPQGDTFTSYPYGDTMTPAGSVQNRFPYGLGEYMPDRDTTIEQLMKTLQEIDAGTARQNLDTSGWNIGNSQAGG